MDDSFISDVRAFNRFYTRHLGLLSEHVAESSFSLAEGRVIYEIAGRGRTTARELVQLLGIDPGYMSRILQRLVSLDLVALTPNPDDRRSSAIALTVEGDGAIAELEELNNRAVAQVLSPLDAGRRAELSAAMQTIRALLGEAPEEAPIVLRPHRLGELGWLIHRQGVLYNRQFGWDGGFEALIATIYGEFHALPAAPPRDLWVADRGGRILGSVFVIPHEGSAETAQLRMLYVEPEARGRGLGRLLVDQAVAFAREAGYRRMRLWTQDTLAAARRIYAAAGFAMVASHPHHAFGKDLVGEFWEREL